MSRWWRREGRGGPTGLDPKRDAPDRPAYPPEAVPQVAEPAGVTPPARPAPLVSPPAYTELGQRLREVGADEHAMKVAERLGQIAEVSASCARTDLELRLADLLSLMSLAVAELRAEHLNAVEARALEEWAEQVAVLLPSDFDDSAAT